MSKLKIQRKRNDAMRFLDCMKSPKINCIKYHKQNTDAHEDMKWKICKQLAKENKHFVTEAILKNGKRADIVVLDTWEIIEILCSETEKQFQKKIKDYPEEFLINKIYVGVKK